MKTTLTLAALIAVRFAGVNAAHAQSFYVGPVAVDLGGISGSYDHTAYYDHGYRPSTVTTTASTARRLPIRFPVATPARVLRNTTVGRDWIT